MIEILKIKTGNMRNINEHVNKKMHEMLFINDN